MWVGMDGEAETALLIWGLPAGGSSSDLPAASCLVRHLLAAGSAAAVACKGQPFVELAVWEGLWPFC